MARDVGETATATTDGAGRAVLVIRGPHRTGTSWRLTSLVITSTRVGDGSYPTADLYRSLIADSQLIGSSRAADRVTFSGDNDWLKPGDQMLIVVQGAAPGTQATANLYGTEYP